MNIWYGLSRTAQDRFLARVQEIAASAGVHRICEIGGGANPFLPPDFVAQHNLEYTVVDISAGELAKAPAIYKKIQADIAAPSAEVAARLGTGYDFVFSQWCAEHVSSGETMHRNIYRMLAEGGRALHIFPTLFSPPFVVNRLMPEALSSRILRFLQPFRAPEGNYGKFPAYYSYCRGPMRSQIRRLEKLGFAVEEYAGFFGHSGGVAFNTGYLNRLPPLCRLHEAICRRLVKHPIAMLTSIAYVVLARPSERKNIETIAARQASGSDSPQIASSTAL